NTFLFCVSPLPQKHAPGKSMKIRALFKNKIFILCFFAIMFGGAAEVTISQWSSVYIEKGLMIPKLWGDLIGTCGFAISMGIGRIVFGKFGEKLNLNKILLYGSVFSALCYIIVAISPIPIFSVVACILNGLCVSLLWPGTLSIASARLPLAGASMFALLAAGGDIGAATGPYFAGVITDFSSAFNLSEQQGLKTAMLVCAVIPIISFGFHFFLNKKSKAIK
ncbi:MAG: MFS transporter, partial [Clostridia bacterium]